MGKTVLSSNYACFIFLMTGCLVLYFLANIESFGEGEEDIWAAYGVKFLNCEYIDYENVTIRLISTPLLKETYIQWETEKSVAKLYAFSDCFLFNSTEKMQGEIYRFISQTMFRALILIRNFTLRWGLLDTEKLHRLER